MSVIRQQVTQSGNDTFTAVELNLPALDGKSGYQFVGIRAIWENGNSSPAADVYLDAYLQTEATVLAYADEELLGMVSWGVQNTAGVAVAVTYEPQKDTLFMEPRVTVQPSIYVAVGSAATGQANIVTIEAVYEKVKLSELDYLRLLAGGA